MLRLILAKKMQPAFEGLRVPKTERSSKIRSMLAIAAILLIGLPTKAEDLSSFAVLGRYEITNSEGARIGTGIEILRKTPTSTKWRYLVVTDQGQRFLLTTIRDAPTGLESSLFLDDESGWWARMEADDGDRRNDISSFGTRKLQRNGTAQTLITHWVFSTGQQLEKTIALPEGDPMAASSLQVEALRQIGFGKCDNLPPTVLDALRFAKEHNDQIAIRGSILRMLGEACGLVPPFTPGAYTDAPQWRPTRRKLEHIDQGVSTEVQALLTPFRYVDALRPDSNAALPGGLQSVLGKQIVLP